MSRPRSAAPTGAACSPGWWRISRRRREAEYCDPERTDITPELVAEHGLKPEEYERILHLIGREPTLTELGIFSAMWNEHCSYKSSKIHLQDAADQRPAGDPGAGRERGRDRHRRRPRGRVQDGEPQPPELHRALSGRGDRRRRHPARRVHHGRAADRLPQCALASAIRSIPRRAISSPAWWPASAATAIRSACRRSAARCASIRATTATTSSTRWRSGSPRSTRSSTRRPPASACRSSISAPRPAATASMAPAWRRRSSARIPRASARPCRSAIRSPRSCCSKPASKSWPRIASSRSRTWARRA